MATTCKLGQLLEPGELPTEDRQLLAHWSGTGTDDQDRRVSAAAMAQALTGEGHPIGETTTKAHRASRCACRRERTTP